MWALDGWKVCGVCGCGGVPVWDKGTDGFMWASIVEDLPEEDSSDTARMTEVEEFVIRRRYVPI